MIIILLAVTVWAHEVAACNSENNYLLCREESGSFLNGINSDVTSAFIVNCDMSEITSEDLISLQNVNVLGIVGSVMVPTKGISFYRLHNMHELRIESCNATEEIQLSFSSNTELITLDLSTNEIKSISNTFFRNLHKIESINLKGNKIEFIEKNAFKELFHLKSINLEGNEIGSKFYSGFINVNNKCLQCSMESVLGSCTTHASYSCLKNELIDQLWTISVDANVTLRENPICGIFDTNLYEESYTSAANTSFESKICEAVQDCYYHEDRALFVKDACSPSPTMDAEKEVVKASVSGMELVGYTFLGIILSVLILSIVIWIAKRTSSSGDDNSMEVDSQQPEELINLNKLHQ